MRTSSASPGHQRWHQRRPCAATAPNKPIQGSNSPRFPDRTASRPVKAQRCGQDWNKGPLIHRPSAPAEVVVPGASTFLRADAQGSAAAKCLKTLVKFPLYTGRPALYYDYQSESAGHRQDKRNPKIFRGVPRPETANCGPYPDSRSCAGERARPGPHGRQAAQAAPGAAAASRLTDPAPRTC
jgi:hypothetical protein